MLYALSRTLASLSLGKKVKIGGEQTQLISVDESTTFKNWKCKNMLYLMNREQIYKSKLSYQINFMDISGSQ